VKKRKPKRGGIRAGSGHPVTTGSASTPLISFRAPSKAAYEQLVADTKAAGTKPSLLAKSRVFPRGA